MPTVAKTRRPSITPEQDFVFRAVLFDAWSVIG
jgi:hypothetical protein